MNSQRHALLYWSRRHYTTAISPSVIPHSNLLLLLDSAARSSPSAAVIYASLLQLCSTRLDGCCSLGLQLHGYTLKSNLAADRFVSNSLLSFYLHSSSGIFAANRIFHSLPHRDVVAWTSLIAAHLRLNLPNTALQIFVRMISDPNNVVIPNAFTLSAAVKACSDEPRHLSLGRSIHSIILRRGFPANRVISTSLIDMYGKGFAISDALKVFEEMLDPDSICWTAVISALTKNDKYEEALSFFRSMVVTTVNCKNEFCPDDFTFGSLLTAIGNLGRVKQGKQAHSWIIRSGLSNNVIVGSSLVDMYAKCKLMENSSEVFDRMTYRNTVSWCALIGGYCQNGNYLMVLNIFRKMERNVGDHFSFSMVLRACAGLASIRHGKEVHCQFLKTGYRSDVVVESALVDLYSKCGLVDYAYRVFVKVKVRNLITWNSLICGFAQNGKAEEAITMYEEMVKEGIKPDYISFIGVLFACGHTGLVEEGKQYFRIMTENFHILPGLEHYSCLVDLLSRVGLLEEAEELIKYSPYGNDSSLWASLLGACATYSNADVGERVANKMMELEPLYHLSYVLLANIYKRIGRWADAVKIRRLMRERGAKKELGKSWIEVKSKFLLKNSAAEFRTTELLEYGESSSDTETEYSV